MTTRQAPVDFEEIIRQIVRSRLEATHALYLASRNGVARAQESRAQRSGPAGCMKLSHASRAGH